MEASFSTGMCTAYPTLDKDDNVDTIRCIISDINELKCQEGSLQAGMEDALMMKNQQEKFMDMSKSSLP